ncbi:MAG: S26 family signal peptidase, partial [Firmicutes bacterium]|nr:S26 family signal peptidase [Bacillota bacterium]
MNETNINETVETIEEKTEAPVTPEQPQEQGEEIPKGLSENAKEWIKDILIAIVVAFLVLQFIKPTIVQEHSMENTL